VEQVEFGVDRSGDFYFLALESVHQIGSIKPENILSGSQHKIASHVLDTIHRTRIGGATHRFRLEHFLVRPSERVNVQRALAVGNIPAEYAGSLPMCRAHKHEYPGTTKGYPMDNRSVHQR
jgi:hypothetical protein